MLDLLHQALDVFLHVDVHLARLAAEYGTLIYGILFLVIFCETGLVVTPFLPGDSLLFAAGALCAAATGGDAGAEQPAGMSILVLVPLLALAAFTGDQVNYRVGRIIGPGFTKLPFVKPEHLEKTQKFYEKHGPKTVIMARFVPIVRTFAPFVAGVGKMKYARFLAYSAGGGVLWVSACAFAGFFFGQIPIVKKNFEVAVIAVIIVSILPIIVEAVRSRAAKPA
jgi:membrane-associated protein